MKMVSIQCPNCNGNLKCDTGNKFIQCPYCFSSFYLDDEKQPAPITINIENYHAGDAVTARKAGNEVFYRLITAIMILFVLSMMIMALPALFRGTTIKDVVYHEQPRTVVKSEAMVRFVENVFKKTADSVTQEEYGSIVYLKTYKDTDSNIADELPWIFTYATEVDAEGQPVNPVTITLYDCKDTIEKKDLQAFPNLVRIDMRNGRYTWDDGYGQDYNLKNLKNLKYLQSDIHHNVRGIVDGLADSSNLEGLVLNGVIGSEDLIAISELTNLKSLSVEYVSDGADLSPLSKLSTLNSLDISLYGEEGYDLSFLSGMTSLKSLAISAGSQTSVRNISVFHGMPQLEELYIWDMKELKNLDFINNMPKLHRLALNRCSLINISELTDKISLSSLQLTNMDNLADVSCLDTLTGLTKLTLYDNLHLKKVPNLAHLPALTQAHIEASQVHCIEGASKLKNLIINDAGNNNSFAFLQTLPELTSLKFDDVSSGSSIEEKSTAIIAGLPKLKEFIGFEDCLYYLCWSEDQSVLFSSKSIEKIICRGGSGELSPFDRPRLRMNPENVPDNYVLKFLNMDGLKINDMREEGNYDSFSVGKYANEILPHLKGVEELSIKDVELQDLSFVKYMPELRKIDFSGNYVKDLTPLISCSKLEEVICINNPLSNKEVLQGSVKIID